DLTFDYGSESRKILNGFSLDIPAGHRVAIVGSSGAGKSTVLRLLLRLYAPSSGSITIDGQPIDEVTLSSLRKNIGVVPQDCSLFHDTVFNNILYGRLDATEEEVIAAAKMAEIHDTIMDFPKGYQTLVGERGLKLSGGERQRIGIARCILKNPELVLFDEATSALDSETEQNILKGFEQLTASRTSLIVAHRLSTVMNCDTICVLDEGKIAEKGSHKELMNIENGKYRQLWERQFLIDEAESLDDDEAAESNNTTSTVSALVNAMRRMLLVCESPLPAFFLELLKRELPRMIYRVLFGALFAVAAFACIREFRFVKTPGHVDQYEDVTVNFIPGRPPELVIFDDDDKEVERVNLSQFVNEADVAKVHEIVQSKGFKKKTSAVEEDEEGPFTESAPTQESEL
ncbi:ATP-binding cassette sub- B member 7, mitochondrial, partial [Perkinsus olseni]